jgi:hypothetical protein
MSLTGNCLIATSLFSPLAILFGEFFTECDLLSDLCSSNGLSETLGTSPVDDDPRRRLFEEKGDKDDDDDDDDDDKREGKTGEGVREGVGEAD